MISFIVIAKDEGWRLKKCISSIQNFAKAETLSEYEIVYVDSKSKDGSIDVALSLGVNKCYLIEGKCNAAIGRNIGAENADGDILFFLDGDMELIPGFLRDIINSEGDLKYPFMSGVENDILHDTNWNYIETKVKKHLSTDTPQKELTTGGLFVIKKELWNKIGGMDNNQVRSQDLDFGFRASYKGFPLLRFGKLWVNHYTQYYSLRDVSLKGVKYTARLTRKHLGNFKAQKALFYNNYSSYILVAAIIISVLFSNVIIPLSGYLLFPIYRSLRDCQRTAVRMNPLKVIRNRLVKDLYFWWYFVSFWPKKTTIHYSSVERK